MFRIYFINFGYYSQNEGRTLDEAKKFAKAAGFQSRIEDASGNPVATYCPISGFKYWDTNIHTRAVA